MMLHTRTHRHIHCIISCLPPTVPYQLLCSQFTTVEKILYSQLLYIYMTALHITFNFVVLYISWCYTPSVSGQSVLFAKLMQTGHRAQSNQAKSVCSVISIHLHWCFYERFLQLTFAMPISLTVCVARIADDESVCMLVLVSSDEACFSSTFELACENVDVLIHYDSLIKRTHWGQSIYQFPKWMGCNIKR